MTVLKGRDPSVRVSNAREQGEKRRDELTGRLRTAGTKVCSDYPWDADHFRASKRTRTEHVTAAAKCHSIAVAVHYLRDSNGLTVEVSKDPTSTATSNSAEVLLLLRLNYLQLGQMSSY